MDFLKDFLSEKTYEQLSQELKEVDDKKLKLANLATGDYVSKQKYDTAIADVDTLKTQIAQRDVDLEGLKAKVGESETSKQELQSLQEKYTNEKQEWETKFQQNAKNASWEISIAKLGVIDPVAMRAHTKDFVEKAEFKDGAIVGFEEHAKELLSDKLKYLVPSDAKALGHEHQQPPKADTVQKQIEKGFGLENKEK